MRPSRRLALRRTRVVTDAGGTIHRDQSAQMLFVLSILARPICRDIDRLRRLYAHARAPPPARCPRRGRITTWTFRVQLGGRFRASGLGSCWPLRPREGVAARIANTCGWPNFLRIGSRRTAVEISRRHDGGVSVRLKGFGRKVADQKTARPWQRSIQRRRDLTKPNCGRSAAALVGNVSQLITSSRVWDIIAAAARDQRAGIQHGDRGGSPIARSDF